MLLSYALVDFYSFYDGAADMQIWTLLTRSQCRVADIQVTVKALGPVVFIAIHVELILQFFVSSES